MIFQGVRADVLDNESRPGDSVVAHNGKALPQMVDEQQRLKSLLVESPVIVAHPKITAPPNILKRKVGSTKWDMVHDGIQGKKRDAASCPLDFQLCPQSLNGGCCPTDRVCGTASCFATSAAPASACGIAGYVACGIEDGGESVCNL
jgi:hypothetical protein